ncbi:hypothetical protein P9112_009003 [Eukaryota sp. TZLM1-RC]
MSETLERFRRFVPSGRVVKTQASQQLQLRQRPYESIAIPIIDSSLLQQALGFVPSKSSHLSTKHSSSSLVDRYLSSDEDEPDDVLLSELQRIKEARESQRKLDEKAASAVLQSSETFSGLKFIDQEAETTWDEDIMFSSDVAPPKKKRNIGVSDMVQTEFHKSFLRQFVK